MTLTVTRTTLMILGMTMVIRNRGGSSGTGSQRAAGNLKANGNLLYHKQLGVRHSHIGK